MSDPAPAAPPAIPVTPKTRPGWLPYVGWAILVSALILILTALAVWQESERNKERAALTTQNLSFLLAKDVGQLLNQTDMALQSAAAYYHEALAHGGIDEDRLNAYLEQQKSLVPKLLDLHVLNAEGMLRFSTGPLPHINAADRAYFARARDDPAAGLIFEGPLLTRASQRWALLLARRISRPDGGFAGVVLGTLPVEAFEEMLSQLDLGPGGTAALRTADLLQVARYPRLEGADNGVGNRKVSRELQALMQTQPQGATYATTTLLDNVFRIYSYRQVENFPFILLVGQAAGDFLAHWRNNAALLLGLSSLAMLIIGLASRGLYRASKKLKAAEARWNFALEGSAQGVWDWDLAKGSLYSSPQNQRLFGYLAEERTDPAEVWFERIHPEDRAAVRDALERHARGEIPLYISEYRMRHQDGHYLWIESRGMTVASAPQGPARRIIGTHTDITARWALEERLRELNTDLESKVAERTTQLVAANRAKSDFLANMSHEIRTPMNAIIGLSQLLLESDLTAPQRDYLGRIYQSATALLNILNDILDYSKIEAGHLSLEAVPLSLTELLAGTRALFALQAEGKHLSLNFTLAPGMPDALLGDPLRLRQVLNNLVGNALKFTHQGGIEVRIAAVDQTAETLLLKVSVQDSGIGLTPEQGDHLFTPFRQADNSTTRRYGGTGLGLSISKRLVELMGGEIGVVSQAGAGSTFWFTARLGLGISPSVPPPVPVTTDLARSSPEKATPGPSLEQLAPITAPIRGARVLVVDDNATNLLVIGDYLTRLGLVAETLDSGRAAVERAARDRYDAILMDLQMPDMDGFAATRAIRAQTGALDLPIIALSAAVMPQDLEASEAAGMCAHVAKPIDPQRLATTLSQWIRLPLRTATPAPRWEEPRVAGEAFDLPGLDLDRAVRMLGGDWGMLRRVLISFHQGFAGAPAQLADALRQEQWDVARRNVHTIKGLTTTIGAGGLHPLALRFEEQLAQGGTTLGADFLAALGQVLAAIAQLPELASPAEPLPANPGAADTRRQDLAEIEAWLRKHRKVPGTLLQRLGGDWGDPDITGLRNALLGQISQFDYARALDTLTLLREKLPS
jgi:PAS domain S-box-containing protein